MSWRLFTTGIMIWLLCFALILPVTRGIAYDNNAIIEQRNEKVQSTIISPSVIWKTTVPGFVWPFHLFSPPHSSDTQLIVTSEWQITGLNLTNGNVLWNISAEQEFKNIYPKLIDWSYSADGSTLIDSDKDGVPELWVTADTVANATVPNIKHRDYDNNISVDNYLFAYDLLSHEGFHLLPLGNLSVGGPPLGGKFYNCTNEVGILVEWTNITGFLDYTQRLALLDSQTLKIVWEAPPLYDEWRYYNYWVYDLTGDGYDEIIASWTEGACDIPFIAIYDGRTFTQLWKTELPAIPNKASYIRAWDIDFIDLNDDGFEDLIVTGNDGGVCAVDGTNGKILWIQVEYPYYGGDESIVIDIDHDDVPEVITTYLEHVMIFNAITGELEVYDHLSFYFGANDLHVADLDGDGEYEIVTTSYGYLYIFNSTFGLIARLDTPGNPCYTLLTDINGDGTLEIIVGTMQEQSPVVAYGYAVRDNTDDSSLSPAIIILIGGVTLNLVLAVAVLILYRWKKLKHH